MYVAVFLAFTANERSLRTVSWSIMSLTTTTALWKNSYHPSTPLTSGRNLKLEVETEEHILKNSDDNKRI